MIDALYQALSSLFSLPGAGYTLLTLLCYGISLGLQRLFRGHVLLHPLGITVLLIGCLIALSGVTITDYRAYVSIIDWLLVVATALLAVPMYQQWSFIRAHWRAIALPMLAGSIIGPVVALFILWLFDAPGVLLSSAAPKSITSPLAMEVANMIGGWPEVAAALVILTGLVGAIMGPWLFAKMRLTSDFAQGLAYGTAAHAIGTATAMQKSPRCGAIATVALCVNGVLTVILLPVIYWLL